MRYCFIRFPEGKLKAVTLSYDDGVKADLKLVKILDKYGMKCTFNLNCHFGNPNKMTVDEIKENILAKGHEIAVHGERHMAPGVAQPHLIIRDIQRCRERLEEEFGIFVRGMAYPDSGITKMHGGNSYSVIREYVKDLGIVYSRTLGADHNRFLIPEDFIAWMPNAHHKNPKLMEYVDSFVSVEEEKLFSSRRHAMLFYLWGHSYEFDNDDNWDLMESFCEKISGKADTWYATNMEIYEYVTAFNSLVFSANGEKIYNPTLKKIWLDVDTKPCVIEPGETLEFGK